MGTILHSIILVALSCCLFFIVASVALVQEIWNLKCEIPSRIIHARKGGESCSEKPILEFTLRWGWPSRGNNSENEKTSSSSSPSLRYHHHLIYLHNPPPPTIRSITMKTFILVQIISNTKLSNHYKLLKVKIILRFMEDKESQSSPKLISFPLKCIVYTEDV